MATWDSIEPESQIACPLCDPWRLAQRRRRSHRGPGVRGGPVCYRGGGQAMRLTAREIQCLDAAVRLGYTGAAAELGVKRATVKSTLENVRSKLDARSTADAYRIARDRGLIAA